MRNKLILLGIVLVLLSSFGLGADSTTPSDYIVYNESETPFPLKPNSNLVAFKEVVTRDMSCIINTTFGSYESEDGFEIGKTGADNHAKLSCFTADIWRTYTGAWHTWGSCQLNFQYLLGIYVNYDADNWSLSTWTPLGGWVLSNDTLIPRLSNWLDIDRIDIYNNSVTGGSAIREIKCWNGTIEERPQDVPPTPTISSLNISNTAPPNLSSFNVQTVNFNLTANASYEFNCTININGTLNQTIDNFSAGENTLVDFDITFAEDGSHDYQIKCDDGLIRENSSIKNFFMDFEVPRIVTNFVNYSIYFGNSITTQFNISDNILIHSLNVSIDDKVIFNNTHIHNTFFKYNLSWDVSNSTVGIHNITIRVADGHTAFELKESYDWSNGLFNDYMKYNFVEGGYVKTELKESSIFDKWTTQRLTDRYTQTLEPSNPSDTITLVEESSHKIHIANKPGKYKGQWIILGDHWKDYVLKDEPDSVVSIKRINDYKVEVTISGIKNTDKLEFESIGDLNVVTQVFPFVVVNSSETYTSPVLETQSTTMTMVLNKTTDVTTAIELFYNGTEQTVTKTPFTNYDLYSSSFTTISIDTVQENVSFYWQYAFSGLGNGETGNLTFNQTTNAIRFDNCTSFTTNVINFTVKNESSGSAILTNGTTIEGYFKVWVGSESDFTEFNLSWGSPVWDGGYGLCVDSITDNFTFNAQLEYDAVGFTSKLYYFNDYVVDSTTDFIDLFLTEGTTAVTLTVKDFDDSVVEGAVIKVLSYDLVTDTSTTTEIVETDSNGEAVVQLILNTQFYVFIVEVDGVIKLQTSPTKISTTTKTLRIDLSDIRYFDRYDVTRGITHSLTNVSSLITFTWSDPSGDIANACLKVSRTTVNQQGTLSDRCLSSTAGTITYNINETTDNNTYQATSYVKFSDATIHVLKTINLNFGTIESYKIFGLTGIFVAFLLTLTLIGVGIWHPVIAVLLGILGITVASIIGIFNVGPAALIGLIILGGIILYKLTKN